MIKIGRKFASNMEKILYRDYIQKSLYKPNEGYFTKEENFQLGTLSKKLPFFKMIGYSDYSYFLNKNYPENCFLTPSEIFSPFYGMSMAKRVEEDFLKNKNNKERKLQIIEIGSGTGTQADSFLSYFKTFNPKLYWKINYTLVEISPISIAKSKQYLSSSHQELINRNQIKFINKDAFQLEHEIKEEVYILMFEVLDNLPHDLIAFDKDLGNLKLGKLTSHDNFLTKKNVYEQCDDQVVNQVFEIWKQIYFINGKIRKTILQENSFFYKWKFYRNYFQFLINLYLKDYALFLPTGFFLLITSLHKKFPKAKFILSDFSSLPKSKFINRRTMIFNNPIISRKKLKSEEHQDWDTIEESPFGKVDIFFPTDFLLTQNIIQNIIHHEYQIFSPAQFFHHYSENSWAETKSGYNPMKEDFQNTRYLHFK